MGGVSGVFSGAALGVGLALSVSDPATAGVVGAAAS